MPMYYYGKGMEDKIDKHFAFTAVDTQNYSTAQTRYTFKIIDSYSLKLFSIDIK